MHAADETAHTTEQLRAKSHAIIDGLGAEAVPETYALLRERADAEARARYAEALAPPRTRAEWDAVADDAVADVAAGRTYSDDELGEYLARVAAGAKPTA